MNPKHGSLLVTCAVLVSLFMFSGTAYAVGPNTHSSCMGQEAAAISPPGTSDEVPAGMPELREFIDTLPGPPGATFRYIASLHEGSHEACDEALE